ncbi:MurJ-like flippase [Stieleria bergensis]|uniref:MurJ-like flippase n=1 Tax=Stieleria bergensis TaxID=2528025 RepID=A0A517SYG3_9BACT|nr:MurJ-like flippase [Planctomycetes bacterium SV_7m_r]
MDRQPAASETQPNRGGSLASDTFSKSLLLILGLMVLQRGVGFFRSFFVCDSLSPEQIGRWDLAFNFLVVAAPVAVLGIPGSFGRYLPSFQASGQSRRVLRQTLIACLSLTLMATFALWFSADWIAKHFLGDRENVFLARLITIGLFLPITFNFFTSWFTGRCLNRIVFRIQCTQSISFAALCLGLLYWQPPTAEAIVCALFGSYAIALMLCLLYVHVDRHADGPTKATRGHLWKTLLPFAVWFWLADFVMGLTGICDRLLIVNLIPHPTSSAEQTQHIQHLVGQYHTACIIPLVLASIGAMISSTGLPYLSTQWEQGNREAVSTRINHLIQGTAALCLVACTMLAFVGPALFHLLWGDKFALGLRLLPICLVFTSFSAIATVATAYLWCIEKARMTCLLMAMGVLCNALVGWLLIDRWGVFAVAASTLAAQVLSFVLVVAYNTRHGLQLLPGTVILPAALFASVFGPWHALASLLGMIAIALGGESLLTTSARTKLCAQVANTLRPRTKPGY